MDFTHVRKKLGLVQKELAKKLGISQGYLSDIESGKKVPSIALASLFTFVAKDYAEKHGLPVVQKLDKDVAVGIDISSDDPNEEKMEETMYKEKYIELLEQHLAMTKKVFDLKQDVALLKQRSQPSRKRGKRA